MNGLPVNDLLVSRGLSLNSLYTLCGQDRESLTTIALLKLLIPLIFLMVVFSFIYCGIFESGK